jgi:hypothetical protein
VTDDQSAAGEPAVVPRPELDLGHVDVDYALHQLDAVRAVVGANLFSRRVSGGSILMRITLDRPEVREQSHEDTQEASLRHRFTV